MWYPNRSASFTIDHGKPLSNPAYEHLSSDYNNLFYACMRCNSAKREILTLDPTASAMADHLRIEPDGSIVGLTIEGRDLIDLLDLDSDAEREFRRNRFRIVTLYRRYPTDPQVAALYREAFGFPDDLPNLASRRPPGGNVRPDGVRNCYSQQRADGRLSETY
jgi:hypothetical protein